MSRLNVLLQQAETQWDLNNIDSAISTYQQVLDLEPKNHMQDKIHYCLGMLHYQNGNMDEAESSFLKCKDTIDKKQASEIYNYLGTIQKAKGNMGQAESYYWDALSKQGNNVRVLNNLANLIIQGRDIEKLSQAEELLNEAMEIEKNNPVPVFNLLTLYASLGKHEMRRAELEKQYLNTSLDMIHDLENGKELKYRVTTPHGETVVEKYAKVIKAEDDAARLELLNEVLDECRGIEDPRGDKRKALGSIYMRLGNTLNSIGQYESAIKNFNLAINLLGERKSLINNRAVAYNKIGEPGKAIREFLSINTKKGFSAMAANCNLAKKAMDEQTRSLFSLKEPKFYLRKVMKNLKRSNFQKIDESSYEVSEAVIAGMSIHEAYVFRRAPHNKETTQVFRNEAEMIRNFHSQNAYEWDLNVVRCLDCVENIHGYNNIVFLRSTGETLFDTLLKLKEEGDQDTIDMIYDKLAVDMVKIRLIGNLAPKALLENMHSSIKENNVQTYINKPLSKFIGEPSYPGSLYNASSRADDVKRAIENNYEPIARILAYLNPDLYKDLSTKNILNLGDFEFQHIDWERLRNLPFVFDMCTVFNMGNYIREKDKLFKKIFDLNNELIQTKPEFQAINNEDFLNLEKFMIAGHAAGVERSMAHHASCTDWHNRLHKEGYDELAKECIRNGLTDLAWLKDNGPFAQDGKDKIKRLEDAFTLIS